MKKSHLLVLLSSILIVGSYLSLPTSAQTLRIASYNLQDKPVTAADDTDIRAIIDAIGDFEVNGVARIIDLLGFQEGPLNTGSYGFLENDFESEFGNDYEVIYGTADSSGDRIGFVYNADKLTLLSNTSISNMGFTHPPMLATFRPIGGGAVDEFSIISIHLKAGSTDSDFDRRETEAMTLGDIVDTLPAGQPVIFLGDFNMKGSDEDAWPALVAAGARDTINAPLGLRTAKWNNSIAFHPFHTQDTTGTNGGMDDRFDLLLVTQALMDGIGIEYNPSSLTAFGNNGTHTFNSNIMSGSGGFPVQGSLMSISDHLPLFADFDWGVVRTTPDIFMSDIAVNNYTVRPSGPRTGNSGTSFFNIEGSDNGTFASFGVVDFDMAGIVGTDLIVTRIKEITLGLVQENASFTTDGPLSVYVASPTAANVTIDSSIQYQSGNNKLDCVPAVLSSGAELAATFPGVHHSPTGADLPDGTFDEIVLYREAIQTAMINALNDDGKFRLIIVPDHKDTAATYAGNTNGTFSGPTISGLYDIGIRPSTGSPQRREYKEASVFDR